MGIGLVTAKELCESLDGVLKISSSKEHGTVVNFSVMVTNKPFQKIVNPSNIKQKPKSKKSLEKSCSSIMNEDVVDDEED